MDVSSGRGPLQATTPSHSRTVAAHDGIRAAVSTFLDDTAGVPTTSCTCSIAVAVSVGGDATAVAHSLPVGPTPGVAGRSGDAVSIAFSGHGAASSTASSGGVGNAGTSTTDGVVAPPLAQPGRLTTPLDPTALAGRIRTLVSALVEANGQTAADADPVRQPDADARVDVAVTSTGPLAQCTTVAGCAIAIGIAVDGTAGAQLESAGRCGGTVGATTAVSIAVAGDATAGATPGAAGRCGVPAGRTAAVTAVAGNTGDATGVALAGGGPARVVAGSGHLGATTTSADDPTAPAQATSVSGSTGDSAGVAIGAESADADVRTGDSGDAAARCVQCALAAGGASQARSGDTGSSYALAGAGTAARVSASTGDSGDAVARALGTAATAHGAGATVIGRSGDTGDAFAVAVDLDTWVTVVAHSGVAGGVVSVAAGGSREPGTATVRPSAPSTSKVSRGTPARHRDDPAPLIVGPGHARRPADPDLVPAAASTATAAPARSTSPPSLVVGLVGRQKTASPVASPAAVSRPLRATNDRVTSAAGDLAGVGLVGIPAALLALTALLAAVTRRRRRQP